MPFFHGGKFIRALFFCQFKNRFDDIVNGCGNQKNNPGNSPVHGPETNQQVNNHNNHPQSGGNRFSGLDPVGVFAFPFPELFCNSLVFLFIGGFGHTVVDQQAGGCGDQHKHQNNALNFQTEFA